MTTSFSRFTTLLMQSEAEKDELFRSQIHQRARQGLRLISLAMIGLPVIMTAAVELVVQPGPYEGEILGLVACIAVLGATAQLSTKVGGLRQHPRFVGWFVALAVAALLIWSSLLRASSEPLFVVLVVAQVAVVLLIVLASIPFRPIHVLFLGVSIGVVYAVSCRWATGAGIVPESNAQNLNMIFVAMLILLSTAVSANLYRQIRETYLTHSEQIRTMDAVRDTQCKMLLSDSAASMGRLAAALSHELNNPLGVLKSNLDTLRTLTIERGEVPVEKRASMDKLKRQLCQNSQESVERLEETVRRMQRFTNLDRAEVLPVDLNSLLRDVASIVGDSAGRAEGFEFRLGTLPPVEVRPQLISAVFSALFQNALDATPAGTPVRVASALGRDSVVVEIQSGGESLSDAELEAALDPSFRVKDGRVAACNWNVFSASQVVREHGGEISITSGDPGALVRVSLPAQRLSVT